MKRVFVANRGEVALRIIRACQGRGLESVLGFSEADRDTLSARAADRAVCIGPARSAESYLNVDAVVGAALATGCDAIHPGYGFLAESADFAEACAKHGLTFVGPRPDSIRMMGDKSEARRQAQEAGVPTLPGTGPIESLDEVENLDEIGFPLLVKAVAGGGGRGIRLVGERSEAARAFDESRREAQAAFGDGRQYLERFIPRARHIEVQVLADSHGHVVHLGERECSVQRRHQKVLEEAPAQISRAHREDVWGYATRLARHIGYVNAGTVEFVYDTDSGQSWFMEMNARLQVEHAVTEQITSIDIVAQQLLVAEGRSLEFAQDDVVFDGHSIEWRITAESVEDGMIPRPGTISRWHAPAMPGIRVDTHCFPGYEVPPFYDSLLAKLVAHGATREEAARRIADAAAVFEVEGVPSTLDLCRDVVRAPEFIAAEITTRWLDGFLSERIRG